MNKYAYLFPGQGSQKPGMGKELYEANATARDIFDRADKTLADCSIKSLCFDADEEELRKTENTQPALYTLSYAVFRVLVDSGFMGDSFAGHSLGEYTAVAAAGYLSFEDGLRVVRQRGILMRDCDPERKGGMAAIIGSDEGTIKLICAEVGDVFPVNFNSPIQIVISGKRDKIEQAMEELKSRGARRAIMLNVSGPFHTPYMQDAARLLERELQKVSWKKGKGTIVSNATAQANSNPELIRGNLVKQLTHPVLWSTSLDTLLALGYQQFIESGPGTVLKGLFRVHSPEAQVFSIEKPEDIAKLKE